MSRRVVSYAGGLVGLVLVGSGVTAGAVAHLRSSDAHIVGPGLHAVQAAQHLDFTGVLAGTASTATAACTVADMGWPAILRGTADIDTVVAGHPVHLTLAFPVFRQPGPGGGGVYGEDGVTDITASVGGVATVVYAAASGSVSTIDGLHGSLTAQLQPPVVPGSVETIPPPGQIVPITPPPGAPSSWVPPPLRSWLLVTGTWSC